MEFNHPLKKRIVEEQNYPHRYGNIPQNPRQLPAIQYVQVIPAGASHIIGPQNVAHSQIAHITPRIASQMFDTQHSDAPMLLNAWCQTHSDEFPPLSKNNDPNLKAKIQYLEAIIKDQAETINQMKKSIAKTKDEMESPTSKKNQVEYRIVNQTNGPNNETQIEIEISSDTPTKNNCEKDQKENTIVEQIYSQIAKSPKSPESPESPKSSNSPKPANTLNGPSISLGPNNTNILASDYERIPWTTPTIATRKLLTCVFDRETLATHSMTGKASPAFKNVNKPVKKQLDGKAIADIIHAVCKKCDTTPKEVRSAITTKCADENKMMKLNKIKKSKDDKNPVLKDANRNPKENTSN